MLVRWLQRFMPDAEQLRANKTLQKFGPALQHSQLWQLNRRSARVAVAVGFFCACLPIPFQMLLAAALAIGFRGHLPLAVGLVWLNNPLTLPVIFYGNYRLGLLFTSNADTSDVASSSLLELSGAELMAQLGELAIPLATGSVLAGLASAACAALLLEIVWRWRVSRRWRQRQR
jgi:hypothetical protein